ncbi:magnesium transporter [soil metagenome]
MIQSADDQIDELREALGTGALERSDALADRLHPADAARLFSELDEGGKASMVEVFDHEQTAAMISHLSAADVGTLLRMVPVQEEGQILAELEDDDLVDILQDMDGRQQKHCLKLLPDSKKRIAHQLLRYPEDTAGGRMTTNLATLRPEMTIGEAIEKLRQRAESTEVLSRLFVVDENNRFLGKVRLRDLTFTQRDVQVRDIMQDTLIAVPAETDQEEAVRIMSKYDIFALPVIDADFKLLGVITHDDALEIQEEENTEDLERQSAIAGEVDDTNYLDTPIFRHIRRRFSWILFLAFLAIISGLVIFKYEDLLESYFVLTIYMPMIVAAGGNTGGQAATMVIRAMALDEFKPSAIFRVAWKETRIGLVIGSLLGIFIAAQILIYMPFETDLPTGVTFAHIAGTVGIALTLQITCSTLIGAVLPILAKMGKLDPAVVASPAITTIVDILGLVIYFGLAKGMLGL